MTLIAIKFNILFLIKNNITYNLIILANYPRNSLIRGVGFFFFFGQMRNGFINQNRNMGGLINKYCWPNNEKERP